MLDMNRLYVLIICCALCGCSDFLKEYSQDKAYVQSYEDLDEILLGNGYFSRYAGNSWQWLGSNGQQYLACVHVSADELAQHTGSTSAWLPSGPGWVSYGYYGWQLRVYEDAEGTEVWDDDSDFRQLYAHINTCNMLLEEITAFEDTIDEEALENVSRIKGECYFLRGSCYFLLVNLFGKPYSSLTADEDPAVPIKLTNYVEDKYYERNTVSEVYEQIESDLLEAEKCLADIPTKSVWRADVNAVRLMLSRMYLYMCDYEEAVRYASLVVENGPRLADLNGFTGDEFLNANLSELIFSMGASSLPDNVLFASTSYLSGNRFQISEELYSAYNPPSSGDLRLQHYVVEADGAIRYKKLQGTSGSTTDLSDVFVLRTSEAYLNLAEAAACAGDEEAARDALNALRVRRIDYSIFDDSEVDGLAGEALVRFAREERRRELCLEGHRWFDLRRYRVAEVCPEEITLTHTLSNRALDVATNSYNISWTRRFVSLCGDKCTKIC